MEDNKIERLVLSIATNQFTVPLPTGKEVVKAVNSYPAFKAMKEALTEIAYHPHSSYEVSTIDVADGHRCAAAIARAALALADQLEGEGE